MKYREMWYRLKEELINVSDEQYSYKKEAAQEIVRKMDLIECQRIKEKAEKKVKMLTVVREEI